MPLFEEALRRVCALHGGRTSLRPTGTGRRYGIFRSVYNSEIDDLQKLRRGNGTDRQWSSLPSPALCTVPWRSFAAPSHPGITYEVQVTGGIRSLAALAAEECDIAISFEAATPPRCRGGAIVTRSHRRNYASCPSARNRAPKVTFARTRKSPSGTAG